MGSAWGTHFHKAGKPLPRCSILAADEAYEHHMQSGSDRLLHAIWRELRSSQGIRRGPL